MFESSNLDNSESDCSGSSINVRKTSGSRTRLLISSDSSTDCNIENNITNTPISRKRRRNPTQWDRNIQKKRRINGLKYRNRSENVLPAKEFFDIVCHCKQKCNEKISCDEREDTMKAFYSLDDQVKQNIFIRRSIIVSEPKRRRPVNNKKIPRQNSLTYYIRKNGQYDIRVCKKYFKDTYQISDARIHRSSCTKNVSDLIDGRGRHRPGNAIDDAHVIKHIKSFPAYSSHYTRAHNPRRKYLNPELTVRKMYELYIEQCAVENVIAVKEKYYYKVFSNKFNLHFKHPAKDTCQTCDSLQIQIQFSEHDVIRAAEIKKKEHLQQAEQARTHMAHDRTKASNELFVFSFDLEEALAFPKLTTSVAYYKRNLYIYNLGCSNLEKNESCMFVWPETEGSRGSHEISSCIVKYIKTFARDHKKIITYSDSCTGQNRNIKTVLNLLKLVQSTEIQAESIEMKFLVSGHSYLPNDSDFAIIESHAKKIQNIFSPTDWYNIIKTCKKKAPFHVIQMTHQDFFSSKPLETATTNRKVTVTRLSVNWLKMRWIKLERSKPYLIQFKYNLDEDMAFNSINIKKRNVGRPSILANLDQPLLYPTIRSITKEKRKDMMDLLKYIPPVNHDYFKNLRTNRGDNALNTPDEEDIIYDDNNTD